MPRALRPAGRTATSVLSRRDQGIGSREGDAVLAEQFRGQALHRVRRRHRGQDVVAPPARVGGSAVEEQFAVAPLGGLHVRGRPGADGNHVQRGSARLEPVDERLVRPGAELAPACPHHDDGRAFRLPFLEALQHLFDRVQGIRAGARHGEDAADALRERFFGVGVIRVNRRPVAEADDRDLRLGPHPRDEGLEALAHVAHLAAEGLAGVDKQRDVDDVGGPPGPEHLAGAPILAHDEILDPEGEDRLVCLVEDADEHLPLNRLGTGRKGQQEGGGGGREHARPAPGRRGESVQSQHDMSLVQGRCQTSITFPRNDCQHGTWAP